MISVSTGAADPLIVLLTAVCWRQATERFPSAPGLASLRRGRWVNLEGTLNRPAFGLCHRLR
jgi:hypothetical protein